MSEPLTRDALRALGVDHLLLVVHDASFPAVTDDDVGRGSPYGRGARDLFAWARGLGFTGAQLGPQGVTSAVNPSPYDGTLFARNPLSLALGDLAADPLWGRLFERRLLDELVAAAPPDPGHVAYGCAFAATERALDAAFARLRSGAAPAVEQRLAAFRRAEASWLDRDASYEARAAQYGTDDWRAWPSVDRPLDDGARAAADRFALAQLAVHEQHRALRDTFAPGEWKLFGDLQVGISLRDRWRREALFLDGYRMGAPPSRTEPEGQPWGYPVLLPGSPDALALLEARLAKLLAEFDGVRVDHPHGLVCPWVYDARHPDPYAAVKRGARLFESPDLADHPALAPCAIARPEQLDRSLSRDADRWVTALDEEQVARYARSFDVVMAAARAAGRDPGDVASEVLSTMPYPLYRVMERHGLGRFRVTQKADPLDPRDGYRSENAGPRDWIAVSTHDTPPLAAVIARWRREGRSAARAAYLAERVEPDPSLRETRARELAADDRALARAMFVDLFASPARHVTVFFGDLLGLDETYNRAGVVDARNWTLRVPPDFRAVHRRNVDRGMALDLPRALAGALRMKRPDQGPLAAALERAR